MTINTDYLQRCINTLDAAHSQLLQQNSTDISYDIFRAACVKEFEIILEQSGKLLKKRLAEYFSSHRAVDRLPFKDIFRHALKYDLLDTESCERWLQYRDNRNNTAHDYGENFAETTLVLLPTFIADTKTLLTVLQSEEGESP